MEKTQQPTPKVNLILARAAQLKAGQPTIVIIDPQFADMSDMLYDAIEEMTGCSRNAVLPMPLNAIKFYQVNTPDQIAVNTTPISLERPSDKS